MYSGCPTAPSVYSPPVAGTAVVARATKMPIMAKDYDDYGRCREEGDAFPLREREKDFLKKRHGNNSQS